METYQFSIGSKQIGGSSDLTVQTMWKKPLGGGHETVLEAIESYAAAGCDLIRFSAPEIDDARKIGEVAQKSVIPVVADIHFDHRIALEAISNGVHKVRINPGNIGSRKKAEEVIRAAADHGVAIRVGINGGSLPAALRREKSRAQAMLLAAEAEMEIIEKIGYKKVVFSLKSSDIESCVEANRVFATRYPYPLHLGLTEAGPMIPGTVKSSIALSRLIGEGIGDTIRVSLSDEPLYEVVAGVELLKAMGKRKAGIRIVSCPRCGRSTFDTHAFLRRVEKDLRTSSKEMSVAVMGCVVNGPEEAKHADLGITGSGNQVLIFQKGKVVFKGEMEDAYTRFMEYLAD